ncbi:carboxymuconolactone decarboxylase family protein [Corallococcus aberystwythensis]|uniref:Carboxymuconolactone decarboxylase family protein n=1 Tax=Corallococcus aberystwythensis TaxID=2316722 RepID=A0A3A8R113_9BACT|nr:hypothetical protein [Corallococcus aberystwythensis]RKH74547.1 hypothetical protein D7W81_00920 [Corallococcus aberystwythensis]
MATQPPATAAQKAIGDFAPKLVERTDDVLFGDVWEHPQLSKRDRSLVTCAGWPNAMSAVTLAKGLFEKKQP